VPGLPFLPLGVFDVQCGDVVCPPEPVLNDLERLVVSEVELQEDLLFGHRVDHDVPMSQAWHEGPALFVNPPPPRQLKEHFVLGVLIVHLEDHEVTAAILRLPLTRAVLVCPYEGQAHIGGLRRFLLGPPVLQRHGQEPCQKESDDEPAPHGPLLEAARIGHDRLWTWDNTGPATGSHSKGPPQ
jgi:hypothetical protein